jgi:hypothetical protein
MIEEGGLRRNSLVVGGYKFDRWLIVARGWVHCRPVGTLGRLRSRQGVPVAIKSGRGRIRTVRVHLADVDQ